MILYFYFQLSDGRTFQVKARFDTEVELVYFRNGGILNYMVRKMLDWFPLSLGILGKNSAYNILKYFSYFSQKIGFVISCKWSPNFLLRRRAPIAYWIGELTLNLLGLSSLWFKPCLGHMWESQVLLTDGQVDFSRVLWFSPTFKERSSRYKWNILERAIKPKSKKKKKSKETIAWNAKAIFLGIIRKIVNLLSAELA